MADRKDSGKTAKNSNADKDAIDILPLGSIALASNALKNAKLVKNARLETAIETAIELYNDPLTGSLQIAPSAISDFMEASLRDQEIINSLAGLHSFDVYSLRNNLKRLGVEVKDTEALELSPDIKEKLAGYNLEFIHPLVKQIFGSEREDLNKGGLQAILRDSDITRVKENLRVIAEKTGIPLTDIPRFLEEYGKVFLSVAYYRYSFESTSPDIERFFAWTRAVKAQREVATSPKTLTQCKQVEDTISYLNNSIRERLISFQESFKVFWKDINRTSFLHMRRQIEENHSSMGVVLCGLVVKMSAWKKEFPDNDVGGPTTRMKFIITELEPGLARLRELETAARKKLGLGSASH